MLLPEQVKPLLLHEDMAVRDMAAEYFKSSWSQDAELLHLVYEACRRYGVSESYQLLSDSERFVVTDEAVPLILELLAQASDTSTAFHLNHMLVQAPVGVVQRNEAAILGTPNMRADSINRINRRQDLAKWSGASLWSELQAFASRSEVSRVANKIDMGYVDDLIDSLAACAEPTAAAICEKLGSYGDNRAWLEIFLVDLAGARRLREAVPVLVEKLHIDGDYLLEQAMFALARIGDVEAVHLIQSAWSAATWGFKNYTIHVLGSIKRPESEEAILAILETETDVGLRTFLCDGLCELFSDRGVDVVRQQIRDGYDRMMICLEDRLLPVTQVLGINLPDADEWRLERQEAERRRLERMTELDELARRYEEAQKRPKPPPAQKPTPPVARKLEAVTAIEADRNWDASTIRNDHARVGRNEPCPCGSGKKFKKCCGRS